MFLDFEIVFVFVVYLLSEIGCIIEIYDVKEEVNVMFLCRLCMKKINDFVKFFLLVIIVILYYWIVCGVLLV